MFGNSCDNYAASLALKGFGHVQSHNGTNEGFEGFPVNFVAFMDVDSVPEVSGWLKR